MKKPYTPGPWTVQIVDGGNHRILEASSDEHEGNARLIEAAPELLRVAKNTLKLIKSSASKDQIAPWTKMLAQLTVLDAAINEAEGDEG